MTIMTYMHVSYDIAALARQDIDAVGNLSLNGKDSSSDAMNRQLGIPTSIPTESWCM